MSNKDRRYHEAVARNITSAFQEAHRECYGAGVTVGDLCLLIHPRLAARRLGIREADTSQMVDVHALCALRFAAWWRWHKRSIPHLKELPDHWPWKEMEHSSRGHWINLKAYGNRLLETPALRNISRTDLLEWSIEELQAKLKGTVPSWLQSLT